MAAGSLFEVKFKLRPTVREIQRVQQASEPPVTLVRSTGRYPRAAQVLALALQFQEMNGAGCDPCGLPFPLSFRARNTLLHSGCRRLALTRSSIVPAYWNAGFSWINGSGHSKPRSRQEATSSSTRSSRMRIKAPNVRRVVTNQSLPKFEYVHKWSTRSPDCYRVKSWSDLGWSRSQAEPARRAAIRQAGGRLNDLVNGHDVRMIQR